jgi:hypothetical protein
MATRIIKWNNGKYGVRVGNWFTGYEFVGSNLKLWSDVLTNCYFDNYKRALDVYLDYKIFKSKIDDYNKHKVLK